ncbi:hypothetical protein [Methylosinus sporium]|uniref:Uncharacterized protein n=1 Tax=Methylosinus sporium TaxID=428 RepID=A0A2U1SSU7_METSR|nr:hypothetical protein [Methylosinus sporium]PWB94696.1 hypothetical protein C5689_06425 [Methylosinus sporium]
MDDAPKMPLGSLEDEATLAFIGLRDQIEILEAKTGRGSRSSEELERMRQRCRERHRIAIALRELAKRRDDLPRWQVALFENGTLPDD